MTRIVYAGLKMVEVLESVESSPRNPIVDRQVQKALKKMPVNLINVIKSYYFDGATIEAIAADENISEKEVICRLRLARGLLRNLLCKFVKSRWGTKVSGLCQICSHPKRRSIDRLLQAKPEDETWGAFSKRLAAATGQNFQPPQVLIAHLRHSTIRKEAGK